MSPEFIEPELFTVATHGAKVQYGVRRRRDPSGARPALMLIGSPMDSCGFVTLASYFSDRPVITYDPRGTGNSARTNRGSECTPLQHADDIRRVITAAGVDAVDLFGSSGGAVNGLVLVQQHPELVHTLVAHEPPNYTVLPDREPVRVAIEDIRQTYQRSGLGPAMAKFIAVAGQQGEFDPDRVMPDPGPEVFGLPSADDGSRDDPLLGQNLGPCNGFDFDLEALRTAPTRIVMAAGAGSAQTMAARSAAAMAHRLGVALVEFPSHHAGFLGGEYGQHGEPEAFAAKLREVLGG